jgi:uncharacterized membrane protein
MTFNEIVEDIGKWVDAAGVCATVVGVIIAAVVAAANVAKHNPKSYRIFRQSVGSSILLGLELLVAADIIRTVAITPSFESVGVLGGIVLIRTFLSFSLELEITGRWPWSKAETSTAARAGLPPADGQILSTHPALISQAEVDAGDAVRLLNQATPAPK